MPKLRKWFGQGEADVSCRRAIAGRSFLTRWGTAASVPRRWCQVRLTPVPKQIGETILTRGKIDHRSRATKAYPILVKVAKYKSKITYGEICTRIGLHPRSARWFLGVIQEWCEITDRPALQAVAVYKESGLPGPGYIASPCGGPAYMKMLKEVYKYKWPKRHRF